MVSIHKSILNLCFGGCSVIPTLCVVFHSSKTLFPETQLNRDCLSFEVPRPWGTRSQYIFSLAISLLLEKEQNQFLLLVHGSSFLAADLTYSQTWTSSLKQQRGGTVLVGGVREVLHSPSYYWRSHIDELVNFKRKLTQTPSCLSRCFILKLMTLCQVLFWALWWRPLTPDSDMWVFPSFTLFLAPPPSPTSSRQESQLFVCISVEPHLGKEGIWDARPKTTYIVSPQRPSLQKHICVSKCVLERHGGHSAFLGVVPSGLSSFLRPSHSSYPSGLGSSVTSSKKPSLTTSF